MEQHRKRARKPLDSEEKFDLDSLLHPAQAFAHPVDVVNDPDLTLSEKHAMLSSWASAARAMEASAALRVRPPTPRVAFDEVMNALRMLDRMGGPAFKPRPRYRRVLEQRIPGVFGRKRTPRSDDRGQQLR